MVQIRLFFHVALWFCAVAEKSPQPDDRCGAKEDSSEETALLQMKGGRVEVQPSLGESCKSCCQRKGGNKCPKKCKKGEDWCDDAKFPPPQPGIAECIACCKEQGKKRCNKKCNQGQKFCSSQVSCDGKEGKEAWLCLHNEKRRKHGACPVVWDNALASGMQTWANHMANKNHWGHDPNAGAGENLAAGSNSPSGAVNMWYNEVSKCSELPGCGDNGKDSYLDVGHFTTVVWKSATAIGCAFAYNAKSDMGHYGGCRYKVDGCGPNCGGRYLANVGDYDEPMPNC